MRAPAPPPAQTLSMFGGFNFKWPVSLQAMFLAASVATFSPEITSPECAITFSYAQKWWVMLRGNSYAYQSCDDEGGA